MRRISPVHWVFLPPKPGQGTPRDRQVNFRRRFAMMVLPQRITRAMPTPTAPLPVSTPPAVTREDRERQNGHAAVVLWFTGLSGAGKTTLSRHVEQRLLELGVHTHSLDGDEVRRTLNRDLGFSPQDRRENVRRLGEVAKLMFDAGVIVLVAVISPYRRDREAARSLFPDGRFVEIFVDTPLDVCEARDPKGLYKRARQGLVRDMTGVDAPYERPEAPELALPWDDQPPERLTELVLAFLHGQGLIGTDP